MDHSDALPFPFTGPGLLEMAPEWAELRRSRPVARVRFVTGDTGWLVTRYEDVRTVLTDPRFSRAAAARPDAPRMRPLAADGASILAMDPPEHTRLHKLVARAFGKKHIERLRPCVEQTTASALDAMAKQGPPADLVAVLCMPLPVAVICQLLGVPYADRERFCHWADVMLSLGSHTPEQVRGARADIARYLAELIEAKRREPAGEDLLATLIDAREAGESLSEHELVVFGVTLLIAGYHTTSSTLANGALQLLRRPEALARLARHPEGVAAAVEEILRFSTAGVNGGTIRVATEDVELGGVLVRAGEAVLPAITSANRDEDVFADADAFDPGREDNPHLAFGLGAHYCLGSQLARLELTVAVEQLVRRFPGLRPAVPEEDLTLTPAVIRNLTALPVTW
ncbi:nocardicin N-oxygenase [Streptomyces olivoverticillatus]|uniref:Nocardicin N-oxygenase n=1 Tax=Streptomyces olivoverticillatus TaxID=66427 RepID=A0A7W7LRV8_9ACTN|nr:cytochrome P450 [Streptomyces olivoverticillatus]MBB4895182.1 nocardicin N-oxygenase [Streptomyces olivoverticillatus]